MKNKLILLMFLGAANCYTLTAQETFKMMFYNLLNFPLNDYPSNRLQYLDVILNDYHPDVFLVCELNNQEGANDILNILQFNFGEDYQMAPFVTNSSDDNYGDQNDLQNLIFYDSSKFILTEQTEIPTLYRDFNHYKLKLNTQQQLTDPIYLDIIVGHLKASSGSDNEALRLQMVNDLVTYLNTIPADSKVLLAGDFNMYTNSEDGFLELTDVTNSITFKDPANRVGSWHNNRNYLDVFTQSTRTQSGLGGASGGFDDRFDFILTSENMISNPEISYVSNSYKVYGNNRNPNCFNRDLNSSDCDGNDYSFAIRNALYNFSDHLPVTVQLQTSQSLTVVESLVSQPIEIIGTNMIDGLLTLKIHPEFLSNQTLNVYDNIGKLIKTINTSNSIYIVEDMSLYANGLYYVVSPQQKFKPLKFVIAH